MIQRKIMAIIVSFSIHKVIWTCLGGPFFSGHGVVSYTMAIKITMCVMLCFIMSSFILLLLLLLSVLNCT